MIAGTIRSKCICVSEGVVVKAMEAVAPDAVKTRLSSSSHKMNPKAYKADYFDQKLHIDQNEKLCMCGVTHECARDGYSGMVVAFVVMLVKNNKVIYDKVFGYVFPFSLSHMLLFIVKLLINVK